MSQKELLEMILQYAEKSIGPPLNKNGSVAVCRHYSNDDIALYLNGRMVEKDKEVFEHHAHHCNICLHGLGQLNEEIENKRLTEAALSYIKNHKPKPSFANILQIAAVWKGKLAWLANVYGAAIIQPAAAMPTRSQGKTVNSDGEKAGKAKKIFKQLDNCGISVEVDIAAVDDGNALGLNFSFLDTTSQTFVEGLNVQLTGIETSLKMTDEDGRASFILHQQGIYDVFVTKSPEKALLHLTLDLSNKD